MFNYLSFFLLYPQTQELIIPGYNSSLQSYLQWRPVVYTTPARDLSSSTDVTVQHSQEVRNPAKLLGKSMLYAFYGEDLEDMLVRRVVVTLGAAGDGFYKKTKFQAW